MKDQGSCAAGWAFAAVSAIESSHCIREGDLQVLSEQHVLDCTADYGNVGCTGGTYYNAWKYATIAGLMTEKDYGWKKQVQKCSYDASKGKVSTMMPNPYVQIYSNSDYMMEAVDEAPAAVMVNASSRTFRHYRRGVISHGCGSPSAVNHSVTVVGYNNKVAQPHPANWIVRNSYGSRWGESGYVRIAMAGSRGVCGINQYMT